MLKKSILPAAAALVVAGGAALAGEGRVADLPHRFSPGSLDGRPVTITEARSGVTWSAWAYRVGGEYAIALSFREPGGLWSEPHLVGVDDRLDQVEPALVADPLGNLYLAFSVRPTGTIGMTALPPGSTNWFEPQQATPPGEWAWSPALRVVGDRLVLAYRTPRTGLGILDWDLLPPPSFSVNGIQEGPDGFPVPAKRDRDSDEDPPPSGSGKSLKPGGSGDGGNRTRP